MSSSNVINGATFNASTGFKYTAPKANKSGGKSVGIQSTETNKQLHLSTPLMMTWGCSGYENPQTGQIESYELSIQFPREQDGNYNKDTLAFLKSMKEYESRIKADAIKNSKDWFGKSTMNPAVVDALFTPMLKYPKDKSTGEPDTTREPTLRIKVPYYDETFRVEIYNLDRKMIFPNADKPELSPVDLIQKTQNVALVIQSGGVWFANGKFGTTWRLVQAVVQPKASILGTRTCHVVLTDKAVATLKADKVADEEEAENGESVTATTVESSEDEAEPAPAPEPAPEPAPAPAPAPEPVKKKKIVRKKKIAE
jgi:hypothetical protein